MPSVLRRRREPRPGWSRGRLSVRLHPERRVVVPVGIVELALVHEGVVVGVTDSSTGGASALDELVHGLAAVEVEGDRDLRRGFGPADQLLVAADARVHLAAAEHDVLLGSDREARDVVVGHLSVQGPAEGGVEGGRALDVLDRAGDEEAHAVYTCKKQVDSSTLAYERVSTLRPLREEGAQISIASPPVGARNIRTCPCRRGSTVPMSGRGDCLEPRPRDAGRTTSPLPGA